jgi:hypothetical protein
MTPELRDTLLAGLADGTIVPYLGCGILDDVVALDAAGQPTDKKIPADSDSLIIAMNGGKPMAPKLMYEFPRAAMNIELKRGRSTVNRFLTDTYGKTAWSRAKVHDWIKSIRPGYVVDINRDTQLQDSYADVPHTLIVGVARIGGTQYRFKIFEWDGSTYREITQEEAKPELPLLFKPMGTPRPEVNFIASDADYVDYITELMGGFAIPSFLKQKREGLRYLLMGLRLNRDTERMVMSDIIYSAAPNPTGWVLLPEPNDKERRFCKKIGLEIIEADVGALMG